MSNNNFIDYEYDDEEFYARQKRREAQNPQRKRPSPAPNTNPRMRYDELARRPVKSAPNDARPYRPNGQPVRQKKDAHNYPNPQNRPRVAVPANENVQNKKKKKKGKFGRFIKRLVLILFVIYFALSAYIYSIVSNVTFNKDDRTGNSFVSSSSLKSDFWIENILFIGVDSRGEEKSRSDTMMLVSIDKKHKKLKITSFLRDTYVTIPGYGESKLNAACFYGGPKLVVDTIEYNFGIDIDHYMLVDFEAFIGIVDALGGTDVDVTATEAAYMRDEVKVPWVKEGQNHFNGFVTLWYCRIRYLDSDFNRTQRQRKVMSCLLEAAKKQNPFDLVKTVKDALPYIQTDMSALEMTLLAEGTVLSYMRYELVQQQVPYSGEYEDRLINEQLVLYIDIPQTSEKIKQFIYE